jgi:two-component system sensor histidine kinase BarA
VSLVYRDTPLSLVGDPLRLKQILTNLVSNAIKFTREGTIVARAMLEDEHEDSVQLRISVQDTGIGLSSRMCARCSRPSARPTTRCRASPAAPVWGW